MNNAKNDGVKFIKNDNCSRPHSIIENFFTYNSIPYLNKEYFLIIRHLLHCIIIKEHVIPRIEAIIKYLFIKNTTDYYNLISTF